jgi:uncharacterized cupin superfamily protein
VVLKGSATLRTPRATLAVRAGDFITFPARSEGAHQIINEGTEPCEILMVASYSASDVCFYPDSRKLIVERADLMIRDNPELAYFDGE